MGSSNKTDFLNLNHWSPEDRPKRLDFVEDNQKIDLAFKNHLEVEEVHVTKSEKEKWNAGGGGASFFSGKYLGSGNKQTISLEKTPDFLLVFSSDRIPASYIKIIEQTGGYLGFATKIGSSGGLTLSGASLIVESNFYPNQHPDSFELNTLNQNYIYAGFCF